MPDQVGEGLLDMVMDLLGMDGSAPFDGYGIGHVGTFVLDLEEGFTVRHSWITDIIKAKSGVEQRISRNDTDRMSYNGVAYLSGNHPRSVRATLARYAAQGATFLLGLPHEGLSLLSASTGAVVTVDTVNAGRRDWLKIGQRCVVAWRSTSNVLTSVDVIIQSVSGGSVTLDVSPSAPIHATLMPAMAIYPEPQQNLERFPVTVEKWNLDTRYARPFDFAPTLAKLDLGAFTISAGFDGSFVTSRRFGLIGNSITFVLDGDPGYAATGSLLETGYATTFRYRPGVTTIGDLDTALALSSNVKLTGTWTAAATIAAGDEFSNLLSGATDQGDVGTGASITSVTLDGTSRPVWDEPLIPGTDGIHAMTQIIDHGGVPYALPTADQADWFRAVKIEGGSALVWQWFKKFMATVIAKQKKFWLPTYRGDLTFVSKAANTVTVSTTDGSDLFAWFPSQREYIQIKETSGTITRAKITAAVDNGNGTTTLTIGVTLASSAVDYISWLELCRFEDADSYETKHSAAGFRVELVARVVP